MRLVMMISTVGAVLCLSPASFAEPAPAGATTPQYSPNDFVKAILSGPAPCPANQSQAACEANPKTRRWSLVGPSAPASPAAPVTAGIAARPGADGSSVRRHIMAPKPVVHPSLSAANVLVTFAVGSAEITAQGQANLQSIAKGLNSDSLSTVTFEVAGYTDSSGPYIDNFYLSGKRADAVKAYLVSLGVKPDRLKAAGYGPDHLADPNDPGSEANRRVELHRLN